MFNRDISRTNLEGTADTIYFNSGDIYIVLRGHCFLIIPPAKFDNAV